MPYRYLFKFLFLMGSMFICNQGQSITIQKGQSGKGKNRQILTIIGLDAGEWSIINYLRKEGSLPTFDKYIEEGASGKLESFDPLFTPVIWTTIATGKTPIMHGINGFKALNPVTGNKVPVNRTMRRCQAIWNILSKKGLSSLVVSWYATWPAEEILGTMVSDYTWPLKNTDITEHFVENQIGTTMKFQTFPQYIYKKIEKFFIDKNKDNGQFENQFGVSVKNAPYALKHSYAKDLTYFKIFQNLKKSQSYDFSTIYLQGTDLVAHKVWREFSMLLNNRAKSDSNINQKAMFIIKYYKFVDKFLSFYERKLRKPNETIMIVSDHGFEDKGKEVLIKVSDDRYEKRRYWHGKNGIIIAHGEKIKPRTKINGATVFDIAPTILAYYGLPLAKDMPGNPILEVLGTDGQDKLKSIASYELPQKLPQNRQKRIGRGNSNIKESIYDKAILETLNELGYIQ